MNWLVFAVSFLTSFGFNTSTNKLVCQEEDLLKCIKYMTEIEEKKSSETVVAQAYDAFLKYVSKGTNSESEYLDKLAEIIKALRNHQEIKYP